MIFYRSDPKTFKPVLVAWMATIIKRVHSALLISEILREVFQSLRPSDCLSASLTCKAWREPALDSIWHTLDNVGHLFQLLWPPPKVRPCTEMVSTKTLNYISRPIMII
jgi:hypothetical protein